MAQRLVGQHAGHHGFAHRHGADADAGVVAALGDDLGFRAGLVDGLARRQDGRGRLDREARHDRLAGGDAAQDAAGMVGQEHRLAVIAHAHLVGILLAGQGGGGEAVADLHALDGVDAHQRAGQFGVQLAIDRRAQPGGNALGHHFDDGADGGAVLADAFQIALPRPATALASGQKKGLFVHCVPVDQLARSIACVPICTRAPRMVTLP